MKTCRLSLKEIPEVAGIGNSPFTDTNYSVTYNSPFWSLHLYDYHATMNLGKEEFKISPGDITITPEYTPASYHLKKDGYHKFIHFNPLKNSPCFDVPLHNSPNSNIRDEINAKFANILRYKSGINRPATMEAAAGTALQEILLLLSINSERSITDKKSIGEAAVEKAAELIENNIEERLSIPKVASKVKMSQNYLAKLFKEHFGLTMEGYLIKKRITLATYLLQNTDMQIKEVGIRVGIPDAQYFNKLFKKHMGKTPSALREND